MYFNFNTVPKRTRTVNRFKAPNPWRNNQDEEWSTEAYLMVNADYADQFVAPTQPSRRHKWIYGEEVYGIRSESDGRYHILPEALDVLRKQNRVPDEAIPRLLFEIEPQLKRRDFRRHLANKGSVIAMLVFFLFVCALVGVLLYAAGGAQSYTPPDESQKVRTQEWFNRPMREGEFVYGDDTITLDGYVPVKTPITTPGDSGWFSSGDRNYALAWFRAGREYRLLLTTSYSQQSAYLLYGVTYSPRTLGIPESLLGELKGKIKNLNTDQVLLFAADNRRANSPWSLDPRFLGIGLFACLIGFFPLALIYFMRRRPRKQMEWLLSRL